VHVGAFFRCIDLLRARVGDGSLISLRGDGVLSLLYIGCCGDLCGIGGTAARGVWGLLEGPALILGGCLAIELSVSEQDSWGMTEV
jgi:hypothetical protein